MNMVKRRKLEKSIAPNEEHPSWKSARGERGPGRRRISWLKNMRGHGFQKQL
jgi:hypothetical protein